MNSSGPGGRVAVVAGGATGLGAATALRLGAQGYRVVVGDLRESEAAATVETITAAGGTAVAAGFDLADPESVGALFRSATDRFGGVDALFNVGADMRTLRYDTDIVDIDLEIWDRVMAVSVRGYLTTMKNAIPLMVARAAAPS